MKNGYHYLRDVINKDTKLISYEAEPIKVTLAPLTVEIKEIVKNEIGQKGTIIFKTYVEEFISIIDTEKKEIFEHVIINKNIIQKIIIFLVVFGKEKLSEIQFMFSVI